MRIAVVGNSNSIWEKSYCYLMKNKYGHDVHNFSIGDSSNIILIDFIIRIGQLEFDYIIIETSVIDVHWVRLGIVTQTDLSNNLIRFLNNISLVSEAKIIFLLIPIRSLLLSDNCVWIEKFIQALSYKFSFKILNGYQLLRSTFTPNWIYKSATEQNEIASLLQKLGINGVSGAEYLSICALKSQWSGLSQACRYAFRDELHVTEYVHDLYAAIIDDNIEKEFDNTKSSKKGFCERSIDYLWPQSTQEHLIVRTSALMTRSYLKLEVGQDYYYQIPQKYKVVALGINRPQTYGIVEIIGDCCSVELDLRLISSLPSEFVSGVISIQDDLGYGPIIIRLRTDKEPMSDKVACWPTGPSEQTIKAEIGELLLIHRDHDAKLLLSDYEALCDPISTNLQSDKFAVEYLESFIYILDSCTKSVEMSSSIALKNILVSAQIQDDYKNESVIPLRVKLLLSMGKFDDAISLLEREVVANPSTDFLHVLLKDLHKLHQLTGS